MWVQNMTRTNRMWVQNMTRTNRMWVKNMTRTNRMWVQNMTGTNRMRVQNMTRTNYVLSKVCAFISSDYHIIKLGNPIIWRCVRQVWVSSPQSIVHISFWNWWTLYWQTYMSCLCGWVFQQNIHIPITMNCYNYLYLYSYQTECIHGP
jgi:hypothetical protein